MKKITINYNTVLLFFFYLFGSIGFVAYISYFIKLCIWTESKTNTIICILGCLITGIPLLCRPLFKKFLPSKLFKVLENIYTYALMFYSVTLLALTIYIFNAKSIETPISSIDNDAVIVAFGGGIKDDYPTKVLRNRLNKVIEILNEKDDVVCIVSGCQGPDENYSEAYVMKLYLVNNGIDADRVLIEDQAKNTIENIQYSLDIINEYELSDKQIICVSNAFHMPRIQLICNKLNVTSQFVFADNASPFWLFSSIVREYMAYVKLFIFGT